MSAGSDSSRGEAQVEVARSLRLEGERVYLRWLRGVDVDETYCRWMNDPEVFRYLETRSRSHTVEGLREYVEKVTVGGENVFLAILLRGGDRWIGNIKLGPIHRAHGLADIGVIIGEKDCWGKGYASEAIGLLAGFGFGVLKMHKLTASCYGNNRASARAFEKAGFQVEGVRRSHFFCEGEYVDAILLGMLNPAETESGE